ncbi:Hypothetical protein NTJ_13448 [Nesidiocoris tenuis]|uniref:Uncharacterized protein n=1 Tax=Nesidiocoris tenuis TaxID=355587 RepID=A0ABN7B8C2_9HEMI|nr:Hypothetical protein NTJ_13448 [Nesidiocoris tenuis]
MDLGSEMELGVGSGVTRMGSHPRASLLPMVLAGPSISWGWMLSIAHPTPPTTLGEEAECYQSHTQLLPPPSWTRPAV